ncbi:MAG TPA: PspC domain-containing protein [Trueperaceae bacterium]|nr:PspC domain-containing protein [Trueperaceae bacterium]
MANDKKLERSSRNKVLAGVCAGIAKYFDLDPFWIRVLFVISGIGILPYIILAIMIPESDSF